jgi:hypothetical protein
MVVANPASACTRDVDPARPQGEQAGDLLVAVLTAAGQAELHPVLDRLGRVTGTKQMPAGAFRRAG